MKLAKETVFVIIIGLFLLAYLLDAVVMPLSVDLASPYEYLKPEYLAQYPFTTASIFVRALAFYITPTWLLSFIPKAHTGKGATLLVVGALMQLYSVQEIATGTTLVPLEWSLSLSVAGAGLLIPAVLFLIAGMFSSMSAKITGADHHPQGSLENE